MFILIFSFIFIYILILAFILILLSSVSPCLSIFISMFIITVLLYPFYY